MSNTDTPLPVLIIGAGPTGLVLALWLAKLGVRVRIVDKVAEPGTTSRAVGVQARTLELYRQIGLAQPLLDAGVVVSALRLWVRGRSAARVPFGRIGEGMSPFPFMLIYPQDEHERLLIGHLALLGVQVERPVELLHFEQGDADVLATLRHADGREETCRAHYLAGCDGAHSAVRETIGVGFPGGTYAQLFYVADVTAAGQAVNDEINVDLDVSELLAVFPLKGPGRARFIGTIREDAVAQGTERTFADVSDRAMRQLSLTVTNVKWFSTYRVHHRVADRFQAGRAFLLGDAAHIHSPAGGQGMNTGIGDAVNLAWKLAAVLRGTADPRLLATYESERIGFARTLVATTDRAFTLASSRGVIARTVRTRLVPIVAPLLLRLPAMRRFMFRTISQVRVRYRGSALSEGAAGEVRGGDRLPWVRLAAGGDNFDALASLRWQVHVYGTATSVLREACASLGVEAHEFAWEPGMATAGLLRDACYLVRPDGYIALARAVAEPSALREYFMSRVMTPAK